MNYQNNEQGLVQLLQKLEYVQGTFPPVYMLDSVLIGYDRLERIKVLADMASNPLLPGGDPAAYSPDSNLASITA